MTTNELLYPFDPTGKASTNLVTGERQTVTPPGILDFYFVIPKAGPYFRESLKLKLYPGGQPLVEGVDYSCTHLFADATHSIGTGLYGSITFYKRTIVGSVEMEYQTVGGDWTIDEGKITEILANKLIDPRITTWEQVVDLPYQFPPINHEYDIDDWTGAKEMVEQLEGIKEAILLVNGGGAIEAHIADKNNPHQTTAAQVNLGNVPNWLPATSLEATTATATVGFMSPVRVRQAIEALAYARIDAHTGRVDNPHQTTKAHVGLGAVNNWGKADEPAARAGTSDILYMTPLMVKYAIDTLANGAIDAHAERVDNPHQVTAAQVQLGNVQNFGLADKLAAEAASANNLYMTPQSVRWAIEKLANGAVTAHVQDYENPHSTTAAQVGAYSIAESNLLLLGKLANDGVAADTNKTFGLTKTQLALDILTGRAADSDKLEGLNLSQVAAQILQGKVADAFKLEGKTVEEIVAMANGEVATNNASQNYLPIIVDGMPQAQAFTKFGWIDLDVEIYEDIAFTISGGCADGAPSACIQLATISLLNDQDVIQPGLSQLMVNTLQGVGGPELWITTGTDTATAHRAMFLWTKDTPGRRSATITDLSSNKINFIDVIPITDPANYVSTLDGTAKKFQTVTPRETVILTDAVSIAAGANKDYSLLTLLGGSATELAKYDVLLTKIDVKFNDVDASSATNGYLINSEAVATAGVKADGSIRVHNYFDSARDFSIRITLVKKAS